MRGADKWEQERIENIIRSAQEKLNKAYYLAHKARIEGEGNSEITKQQQLSRLSSIQTYIWDAYVELSDVYDYPLT